MFYHAKDVMIVVDAALRERARDAANYRAQATESVAIERDGRDPMVDDERLELARAAATTFRTA